MKDFFREIPPHELLDYGFQFFPIIKEETGIHTFAHMHPAVEILYIVSDNFEIGIDQKLTNAGEGDVVLFRSNVIHTINHTNEGKKGIYFVLKVTQQLLCRIFSGEKDSARLLKFLRRSEDDISVISHECLPVEIKQVWEKMINEYKHSDELFFAIQRTYIGLMLLFLLRYVLSEDKKVYADNKVSEETISLIYDCIDYINENYASDITANQCAEYIHLSYSHFAKLFKDVIGKSFKEHLIDVRLSKAYNSVISDSASITEIAYSCGYKNLSHFICEFKKMYGASPNKIRKRLK